MTVGYQWYQGIWTAFPPCVFWQGCHPSYNTTKNNPAVREWPPLLFCANVYKNSHLQALKLVCLAVNTWTSRCVCICVAMVIWEPDCVHTLRYAHVCITVSVRRKKVEIKKQNAGRQCAPKYVRASQLTCRPWRGLLRPCRLPGWTPWQWSKAPADPQVSSRPPRPGPAPPPLCDSGPGHARPAAGCSPWS